MTNEGKQFDYGQLDAGIAEYVCILHQKGFKTTECAFAPHPHIVIKSEIKGVPQSSSIAMAVLIQAARDAEYSTQILNDLRSYAAIGSVTTVGNRD